MDYRIIASDLDGTLLGPDERVSEENWAAIRELQARGIHFVPASGRAFEEMPAEIRECPFIRYYITSDGCMIYDKKEDQTIELAMDRELTHRVLDKLYEYPFCMMVHTEATSYVDLATHNEKDYKRFNMNRKWIDFTFEMEEVVPDLKKFAYGLEKTQSLIPFFEKMEDLLECKAFFEQDPALIVAQSYLYNLEIFSSKGGKGNALMMLADHLGVDRKATIAVGDTTNDRTMIQAAGLGLAMENAVPELKEIADQVICHHGEHNIKYILENFIK